MKSIASDLEEIDAFYSSPSITAQLYGIIDKNSDFIFAEQEINNIKNNSTVFGFSKEDVEKKKMALLEKEKKKREQEKQKYMEDYLSRFDGYYEEPDIFDDILLFLNNLIEYRTPDSDSAKCTTLFESDNPETNFEKELLKIDSVDLYQISVVKSWCEKLKNALPTIRDCYGLNEFEYIERGLDELIVKCQTIEQKEKEEKINSPVASVTQSIKREAFAADVFLFTRSFKELLRNTEDYLCNRDRYLEKVARLDSLSEVQDIYDDSQIGRWFPLMEQNLQVILACFPAEHRVWVNEAQLKALKESWEDVKQFEKGFARVKEIEESYRKFKQSFSNKRGHDMVKPYFFDSGIVYSLSVSQDYDIELLLGDHYFDEFSESSTAPSINSILGMEPMALPYNPNGKNRKHIVLGLHNSETESVVVYFHKVFPFLVPLKRIFLKVKRMQQYGGNYAKTISSLCLLNSNQIYFSADLHNKAEAKDNFKPILLNKDSSFIKESISSGGEFVLNLGGGNRLYSTTVSLGGGEYQLVGLLPQSTFDQYAKNFSPITLLNLILLGVILLILLPVIRLWLINKYEGIRLFDLYLGFSSLFIFSFVMICYFISMNHYYIHRKKIFDDSYDLKCELNKRLSELRDNFRTKTAISSEEIIFDEEGKLLFEKDQELYGYKNFRNRSISDREYYKYREQIGGKKNGLLLGKLMSYVDSKWKYYYLHSDSIDYKVNFYDLDSVDQAYFSDIKVDVPADYNIFFSLDAHKFKDSLLHFSSVTPENRALLNGDHYLQTSLANVHYMEESPSLGSFLNNQFCYRDSTGLFIINVVPYYDKLKRETLDYFLITTRDVFSLTFASLFLFILIFAIFSSIRGKYSSSRLIIKDFGPLYYFHAMLISKNSRLIYNQFYLVIVFFGVSVMLMIYYHVGRNHSYTIFQLISGTLIVVGPLVFVLMNFLKRGVDKFYLKDMGRKDPLEYLSRRQKLFVFLLILNFSFAQLIFVFGGFSNFNPLVFVIGVFMITLLLMLVFNKLFVFTFFNDEFIGEADAERKIVASDMVMIRNMLIKSFHWLIKKKKDSPKTETDLYFVIRSCMRKERLLDLKYKKEHELEFIEDEKERSKIKKMNYEEFSEYLIKDVVRLRSKSDPEMRVFKSLNFSDIAYKYLYKKRDELIGMKLKLKDKLKITWDSLTKEEKLFLVDLAKDGVVNLMNRTAIISLTNKKIIVFEGYPRFTSRIFKHYINNDLESSEVHLLASFSNEKGIWSYLHWPILLMVVTLIGIIFISSQEFFNRFVLFSPLVGALIPAILSYYRINRNMNFGNVEPVNAGNTE
ncbi:hypothetical protein [Persicobacter diffluens]|uniref:hypothetical protein n=1 Tax=Persicobacter diffluens TaxID=981 RepID=UPI0030C6E52F